MTVLLAIFCVIILLTVTNFIFPLKTNTVHRILVAMFNTAMLTFYVISMLLENGFGNLRFSPYGRPISKIVLLILAFTCVILGNLYKSIITTDMITPHIGTIPYENFSQLTNFTFLALAAVDLRANRNAPIFDNKKLKDEAGISAAEINDESFQLGQYMDEVLSQVLDDWGDYTNAFMKLLEVRHFRKDETL
jgi:hypothetical protein